MMSSYASSGAGAVHSGSGSEKIASVAPALAPGKMCRLWRLPIPAVHTRICNIFSCLVFNLGGKYY